MSKDLSFGSAALALAAVYYLLADALPTSLLSDSVGPGGLPKAYAVVLAGLAAILIVRSLLRRPIATFDGRSMDTHRTGLQWTALRRAGGICAIGITYIIALPWLGYVLSLTGLIIAATYCQGGDLTRRTGLVALLGAAFFWLLFVAVLRIPQPAGLWPALF